MYDNKRMDIINFIVLIVLVCNVKYDFVSGYHREEVRCLEKEREALVRFRRDLIDDYGLLSSWGNETRKKECCKWRGVQCSNTTGHVIAIQLPGSWTNDFYYLGGEISSALLELHHLKDLDLSENDFGRKRIPEFMCSMTQLRHLDLTGSNFSGIVPPQLGNLTNLKTLALAYNNMWSDNLRWLNSDLSFLSVIILSVTKISDANWAQHILKLPSLQELHLETCGLVDVKPSSAGLSINSSSSTPSLSILNLSENNLTSFTIDWLFNDTGGTSPVATNLRTLYLWGNKLKTLPSSILQLSKLKKLDVSSNSLEGTITEANLTEFHNLKNLALSFNLLTIDIKPDWVPPFHLDLISLAGCNIGPRFPLWLRTQSSFWWLDLSNNGISGEVPKWFWTLSPEIQYLNISRNEFSGTLPDYSPTIKMIDVSFNKFSGHIPLLHPNINIFQLSQNMLSGSISSLCTVHNFFKAWLLDLSSNQLEGKLPNCWQNMTELHVLNLSNNSFSGEIPHALGSLSNLYALQLGNNNLTGELPSTLENCKYLQLFDVQDNMLTGNIPTWIGKYHGSLTYLNLRNNRFQGSIPPQICSLTQIQVLDLSRNHLSGNILPCFNNFTLLVQNYFTAKPLFFRFFFPDSMHSQDYIYYSTISWKRKESEYKRNLILLKLIDLSSNRLVGDIPRSLFSLRGLRSLNLSRNSLSGTINPDIGQMEMLDSLDLSSNQLSGAIPVSMSQLNFLGVLDLANNNLSGKIPPSTKLQSVDASAYAGNAGLCGIPLPLCPGDGPHPSTNNKSGETDDDGISSFPFLKGLVISIVLGFIFGFWGVVGSLIVKESWRRAYFYFSDAVGNWLYVTTAIFWAKFIRRS